MCKAYALLAATWISLAGCERTRNGPPEGEPAPRRSAQLPKDAKSRLDLLVQENLDAELAYSPTLASWLGAHGYDDRIDDVRIEAQAREAGRLTQLVDRLQAIDPAQLDVNRRLDRELLLRRSQL